MRPSISILISVLAIGGLISGSCVTRLFAQEPGKINHIGEAMKSDEGKCYLRLNNEERQRFLSTLSTIKIGDSRKKVESLLGVPSSDDQVATKEKGKFIGRFVTYYLTKCRKEFVNERQDEWVLLKFGVDDKLETISVQIHGMPKDGWPGDPSAR